MSLLAFRSLSPRLGGAARRDLSAATSSERRLHRVAATSMLVMLLAVATPAVAQEGSREPLVTDRPDATESTETVFAGGFQLESGYTFGSVNEEDTHSLGEVLLRIGVADNVEVRVGLNSYEWLRVPGGTVGGLSDTSLGVKVKLVDGARSGSGIDVAVIAATTIPTGSDDFGAQQAQPSVLLAAARDLSDVVGLAANVGWNYAHDDALDERDHELLASVALGIALSESWGAFLEYFGTYTLAQGAADENFVDGGLTYLIRADLQLDVRVGYGLNGRDGDFFVGLGTAVRW